jgi:hypothetical protein
MKKDFYFTLIRNIGTEEEKKSHFAYDRKERILKDRYLLEEVSKFMEFYTYGLHYGYIDDDRDENIT